jgi:undecaprenyl-diphosphatase
MVVPLILGKMSMDILNGSFTANSIQAIPLLAGFLAAFTTGVLACVWMIRLVKNSKLRYFSVYCWVAAIITAAAYFLSNVYV